MKQVRQKIQPNIPMPLKVFYKIRKKKGCKDICAKYLVEKRKKEITLIR